MPNSPQNSPYAPEASLNSINIKSFGSVSLINATDAINHAVQLITRADRNATQKGAIYFPPHTYTIKSDCTIPAGVSVVMEQGAVLSVDSGKTLTIAGPFEAPESQVFSGSGTVVVSGTRGQIVPHWWGAASGGTAATNVSAIQAAAASAFAAGSGGVFLPLGTYSISSTIDLTNYPGISFFGAGAGQALDLQQGSIIRPTGDFPAIRLGNTSGITVNQNPVHHHVYDLQIYGNSTGTSQHGIVIAATESPSFQASFNVVERVLIWNMGGDGLRFQDNAWNNAVRNCQIYACDGDGIGLYDESNSNNIDACWINGCAGDGVYLEGVIYNSTITNSDIESNTGWGVNVSEISVRAIKIDGCYIENNHAGQINNAGNTTTVFGTLAMQQSAVVGAGIDIVRWSGNNGIVNGLFTTGDCRYTFNLADSSYPVIIGGSFGATASGGDFNLANCTGPIIAEDNNRLIAPILLARSASDPKISAIDTTTDLETVLISGDANGVVGTATNHAFYLQTNNTRRLTIDENGNIAPGTAALATNATTGHFYIPTCAGTPTGVPTTFTGRSSLIFDTTNNKLYVYDGGWVDAGFDTTFDMFNVKAYGAVGDGSTNDTAAINAAIAAANAVTAGSVNVSKGATVYFPPGLYLCNSALTTPTNNVTLLGGNGVVWSTQESGAAVLKMGYQNGVLLDVSNSANVTIKNLGFFGGQANSSGADLAHIGIYASTCTNLFIVGCSLTGFGGPAIRVTGFGKWLEQVQTTRVLLGYASLVSQSGGVYLDGTENQLLRCNFNGPAFNTSTTHGEYGSGYAAAVYLNGAPIVAYKMVGAGAQVGIVVGDSVGSSPSQFTNCRAEFNQGHGWVNLGANVCSFTSCSAYDNNRDTTTPTYSGFYGVSATGFSRNTFSDCIVTGIDGTYLQLYGFTDQNNGGGNVFKEANHYNAGCRAPGLTLFNPTFGACPPIIGRQDRTQAGSLNTTPSPDELTFNGTEGNIWRAAIASGAATKILATSLLPGQIYTLYIVQPASAGTVTLDAVFAKTVGFVSPANSKQLTGQFYSDGTSLYQVSAWSGDM
jgi:hypothetical protein